jgi:hypothetical protein
MQDITNGRLLVFLAQCMSVSLSNNCGKENFILYYKIGLYDAKSFHNTHTKFYILHLLEVNKLYMK